METMREDYHKAISELEDYAIIYLDVSGNVKDWNKGAENIKEYKAQEIIGKNFSLFYTQEDQENNLPKKLLAQAKEFGKATDEGWRVKKDGTLFWGSILINALYDNKRNLTGFLKITRDLTDRKRKEESSHKLNKVLEKEVELRTQKSLASEIHFKNTLDNMLEGIQIHDFNWAYSYVNETYLKRSKYSRDELIGKTLFEMHPGIENSETFKILQRCMVERKSNQFEGEFTLHDGKKAVFELSIQPVQEGLLILSVDTTERYKAREKVVKKNRLYSFLSAINQSIVHIKEEQELFEKVCDIASDIGKFKSAYIALVDSDGKLGVKSIHASKEGTETILKMSGMDINNPVLANTPTVVALKAGKYTVNNDMLNDSTLAPLKEEFIRHGIQASISLPLKMFGKVVGIMGFHSSTKDFFDEDEIALLTEAAGDISFALENFEKTREHQIAEELVIQSEKRFRETLNNMHEGIQIHDFNWKYVYANDVVVNFSSKTREELLEKTLFEILPDIEKSSGFEILQRCMIERKTEQFESELVLPNGEKMIFEFSVQPVPEGILILSVNRTSRAIAQQKLKKKNRLYSFLSAINQSIVHIKSEDKLLNKVVEIAKEIGEYKSAYTGMLTPDGKLKIKSVYAEGAITQVIQKISGMDLNDPLMKNIAWVSALKSGQYTFNNDMQNDPALAHLKEIFIQGNVQSSISLPLKMFGKVAGLLAFHSSSKDFFDEDEIALLVEAAGDISFALENYEKTKKHEQTELLIEQNEKRFRGLIEKSTDMTTITDKEGKLVYVSPSVIKLFKFSEQDLIGQRAMTFFHSDDISDLIEKRNAILNIPGGHYDFTVRLKHKEEDWVWCEGTVINYLEDNAIQGMVTNFRDITLRKQLELQQEFDRNNLSALINNTKDLMWSVDRLFKLITSNKPFDELIQKVTQQTILNGANVLHEGFGETSIQLFKQYYERAFMGEVFSVVRQDPAQDNTWTEVSFYPIQKGQEIIGTACFSKDISESKKSAKEKEAFIAELSQNNQDLRQFAYITSHNLRGPVANLLGLVNLLDNYNFDDPSLVKIHEGIKKASKSFDETIRDLAGILTIKEGSSVSTERILFEEICEKVLSFFESAIAKTGVKITCDFSEAQEVIFNRAYLESIFTNLLSNSIKYRDKGRTLVINAKTVMLNEELILSFSDNGMGFDSEKQKGKIFQLYQRFHAHAEGKGLGLYLIKSQIEALGGTISVQSQPNKGTIFTITFKKRIYLEDDAQIQ